MVESAVSGAPHGDGEGVHDGEACETRGRLKSDLVAGVDSVRLARVDEHGAPARSLRPAVESGERVELNARRAHEARERRVVRYNPRVLRPLRQLHAALRVDALERPGLAQQTRRL